MVAEGGEVHVGEVVGILGPNGIGKSTFLQMVAGELAPDSGTAASEKLKVSYKPQYIKPDPSFTVREVLLEAKRAGSVDPGYCKRIERVLELGQLEDRLLSELSGGELQRVAIAQCLSRDADLYLLDEPSAFLDVEMRLAVAKLIRRSIEGYKKAAFVVEHDIVTQDFIADSLLVFSGTPGVEGRASPPLDLREGMNRFLSALDVTFRRDVHTGRPRVNKPGSQKDEYQKKIGEYYYYKVGA